MKKSSLILLTSLIALSFGAFYFFAGGRSTASEEKKDPEFKEWVAAYTSGYVTIGTRIRVVLQTKAENISVFNKETENTLFDFSPSVKGKMIWLDESTIEFRPEGKLKHNQEYEITFKLGEAVQVKKELSNFVFSIQTIPQAMDVKITDYSTTDKSSAYYITSGIVTTADECDNASLEKTLRADFEGEGKKIQWTHDNATTHRFAVEKVKRHANNITKLVLSYNSEAIEGHESGEIKTEYPGHNQFRVLNTRVCNDPDQQAIIFFSDELNSGADLNGLFELEEDNEPTYTLEKNKLIIFPSHRLEGNKELKISDEIVSAAGKKLGGLKSFNLKFEEMKPEIRFTGKGNIIPGSDKLLLPFEAVNISAVDVKIKKIYEKNILQFLQVNSLDGTSELNRVGKTIFKKKIELSSLGALPKNKWQNYALDLSKLIRTEPGAIYNVSINFKRAYSIYDCQGDTSASPEPVANETEEEQNDDEDSWNNYNSYDYEYYYDEGYDYRERENPCHSSYYSYGRSISRNVLCSNTALLAKRGNDGSLLVMASDIISAKPLSGVEIEAYDFQQIKIAGIKTNSEGIAQLKLNKKPFALIARNGSQKTYLKLDDGASLSMSMFEVEGEEIKKGMKGFIYGERGIWRPGDSLYLSFILENRENMIPETFPVTMEITNPQGQVVQKITRTKNLDGFYDFRTKTESYAPTGTYTAKVKAGGAVFTKSIRIETIMPNRLKLNLDFHSELVKAYEPMNGDLQVNWLHGAPGRNLETKIDLTLTPGNTQFKNFKDFSFDNPAVSFYSEPQTFFSGRTDENGYVKVNGDLSTLTNAPGFLNANFTIRAFEEGGAFSTDRFTIPVSPFKEYVGLKTPKPSKEIGYLYTGKDHNFEIVNVNENGNLSAAEVEVNVYKVNWRWWWDDYNEDFSSYMSSEYHTPLQSEKLKLENGRGNFSFRIDQPEWGRYLVLVKNTASGHTTGGFVHIDWPSWEGKSPKGNEGANFLSVSTEKSEYNVGEKIKIYFPSAEGTKALITVENGSRVIKNFWAETNKDSTLCTLDVTEEMTPNIYIYVTLIQPHKNTANDLPIRLYGLAQVKIQDPDKILSPVINTQAEWKPESTATIQISEKQGKEMTYTLAVVDDGLLDLTRFKTPDPYAAFYAKEALGVKSWDVYDQVMGATAGGIQRILSIGGDEGLDSKQGPNAQRFKPMVRYIGPFRLEKGKTNTHKIDVPQYVGSVRIMVIAGKALAYGNAEKTVPVRKPLMILSTLPRVLGPGEEVDLPVTVFAMDKKVKSAIVTIKPDNNFELPEGNSREITFNSIGDQVVNFRLKVKEKTGWANVKINAKGAGENCNEEINIELRSPNPKMSDAKEAILEANKSMTMDYKVFGINGTNTASLEISSIPSLNLENRLNYLIEYPHGCIEQTTSSVFAQLYLEDLMELNTKQKAAIEKNVKAAITRIKSFQTVNGGFAYWPGSNYTDDWGSNYAGHFLLEAQKKGYNIPSSLLDGWKRYQQSSARQWQGTKNAYVYHEDHTQAYRLYTLALAGTPELGAMNRLKENKDLNLSAKWRLAAAYVLAGQKEVAKKMITGAKTFSEKYTEHSYTYGSGERDEAMILEALTLMKEDTKAFEMLRRVAGYLSSNNWMSTQTTAYCLISVSGYVKNNSTGKGVQAECKIGGSVQNINSTKSSFKSIAIENAEKSASISIKNKSGARLFVRLIRRGVPAAGNETEGNNNLNVEVNYKTLNGEALDVTSLQQGTDFVAEVSIVNYGYRGYLSNLALTQIFPSGWEIHNSRLDENSGSFVKTSTPTYQDIRDDRIYTYYDLGNGGKKTFRIILNASYTGKFYLPGIKTEAMYDASVYANKAGKWVEVKKGGVIN